MDPNDSVFRRALDKPRREIVALERVGYPLHPGGLERAGNAAPLLFDAAGNLVEEKFFGEVRQPGGRGGP